LQREDKMKVAIVIDIFHDKSKYIVKDYNNSMTFQLDCDPLGFISPKHNQFHKLDRQRRYMEKN